MVDVLALLKNFAEKFNPCLLPYFKTEQGPEKRVVEAMSYSVMNGGKRIRPFLISECAKLFGIPFEASVHAGVALEMLHTYSLIHDDLPAMDNDDLRRGKPTCHKRFDEATAILAGDGLLTLAFEILADAPYNDQTKVLLTKLLAEYAGAQTGMVAGQMLDLYAETNPIVKDPEAFILHIESMKTARLLQFACVAGAILGGADKQSQEALKSYAYKIGIAFQIADDILDVEGSEALVGKTLKSDSKKITFVSCYGLEQAKIKAQELVNSACQDLEIFKEKAEILKAFANFVIARNY